MDKLNIVLNKGQNGSAYADLLINDRDFIEIVKDIEMKYATAEGHPKLAGSYDVISVDDLLESTDLLLGKRNKHSYDNGKITVLDCECGCGGCWPLTMRITVTEDFVTWSDFKQVHRNINFWTYAELKPFRFSREEYVSEIVGKSRIFNINYKLGDNINGK